MEGVSVLSAHCTDPQFTAETQLPEGFEEESKQAEGVWLAENAFFELEDSEWLKHILAAEVAEVEALKLSMLTEAKHCPSWLL